MTSRTILTLAVIALLSATTGASAQPMTPNLEALHRALNLSTAQETAWRTFEASASPDPMQAARERSAAQMLPTLPAPRRIDLAIATLQADLQTLERRGQALKAFYATLSPAQQATFDRLTLPNQSQGG